MHGALGAGVGEWWKNENEREGEAAGGVVVCQRWGAVYLSI